MSNVFESGQAIEVFNAREGKWLKGMVVFVWDCIEWSKSENCERKYKQYDVEGTDDCGGFHGTWDEKFVRKP